MEYMKPIPGFPGYFASADGTIWTQKRKGGNDRGAGRLLEKPRPLKTHLNGSGYLVATLDLNGKPKSKFVHRLILETFVGPAPHGYHGCHYPDTTRSNNRVENIRWDSPAENVKDKFRDKIDREKKTCTQCNEEKLCKEFYKDSRNFDGLKSECKVCHQKTAIATRDENKKRIANRKYMQRKRLENPKAWR